jgi:hypothetical protein
LDRDEALRDLARSPGAAFLRATLSQRIEDRCRDIAALAGSKEQEARIQAYAGQVNAFLEARDLIDEPKPQAQE